MTYKAQEVRDGRGHLLAQVVRYKDMMELPNGANFLTNPLQELQVGCLLHETGSRVPAHYHPHTLRETRTTSEVLVVMYGKVRVRFYSEDSWDEVQEEVLCSGDVLVLVRGGHEFEFLARSWLVEVKSGPYAGGNDKVLRQGSHDR